MKIRRGKLAFDSHLEMDGAGTGAQKKKVQECAESVRANRERERITIFTRL